ncbi:transporter substrate-binding domain-containing protein [Streptomyces nitrosporeus]|uniref:transporter substrate-binding domain-containing protein n=1 Tax=Streptomyces nitrosporeus TaxID=28894 RepID=UPI0039A01846
MNGRTTRQLQDLFSFGRTQWSEFLKGRKLIPLWLLDDVVTKLVPPRDQQLQRGIGHKLLHDAEQADEARRAAASPAVPPGDTPHEYRLRLDDARQGQIKAQETVQSLTHLIYAFITVMADLSQRCKNLEAERDQARLRLEQQEADTATVDQQRAAANRRRTAEDQQRLAEVEQRLAEAERRHAEFEERLARARREQREAEDLRIEAFWKAEENRRAFRQLTGQDAPAGSAGQNPGTVEAPQPWEYDHFLETADAQLDSHNDSMDAVREQISAPTPPVRESTRTIPGQVVPASSADGVDIAPAGGAPVRPASADSPDSSFAAPSEGPAPMPENTDRRRPGTVPPEGGAAARSRGKGRGPRVALTGAACLALLAGGGWLTWDHYNPDAPEYTLEDSATIQRAMDAEVLKIGVKEDQPGLSENVGTDGSPNWKGFDIEVAKKVAKDLGFGDRFEFVEVGTRTREQRLQSGDADIVVGSYSIIKEREEKVDFSVPYLITDQGMMVYTGGEGEHALVEENGKSVRKKNHRPRRLPRQHKSMHGGKLLLRSRPATISENEVRAAATASRLPDLHRPPQRGHGCPRRGHGPAHPRRLPEKQPRTLDGPQPSQQQHDTLGHRHPEERPRAPPLPMQIHHRPDRQQRMARNVRQRIQRNTGQGKRISPPPRKKRPGHMLNTTPTPRHVYEEPARGPLDSQPPTSPPTGTRNNNSPTST